MARRGSQGDGGDTAGTQRGQEVLETTEVSHVTGGGETRGASAIAAEESYSCAVTDSVRKWRRYNYFVCLIKMLTSMYLD